MQGPLVDAQLEMRALHARTANSASRRACAPRISPMRQDLDTVDYFGTLDWQHRGQRVDTPRSRRILAAGHRQQRAARRGSAGRRRPRRSRHRRFRAACWSRTAARARAAARRELRIVAAPRAGVRRELRRRELRRGRYSARRSTINSARSDRRPGDAHQRRYPRSPHALRGARYDIESQGDTNSYGAELQWDTRTAAETRTYLRARRAERGAARTAIHEIAWLAGARREHAARAATSCSPICRAASARLRPASSSRATSCGCAGRATSRRG